MKTKKSLGQHFLMHTQTAERIADAAKIKNKTVLEIGPGTGKLTRPLLARAKKVIAIETDALLIPELKKTFAIEIKKRKLVLIHGDVRDFDASSIKGEYSLVANIPYYITGDIIRRFLEAQHKPESITLLVQKEVAERIARSKFESLLSISVKVFGIPHYQFTVPKGAFVPAPKVDSAVISIDAIHSPFPKKSLESMFFELVRAGFAHKRKLLLNNLKQFGKIHELKGAFTSANIKENARAETVSVGSWLAIFNTLQDT